MDDFEPLTAEDYESVHRAGRLLAEQGWSRVFTLNQMLQDWQELIETLEEEDYDCVFAHEWDHDLRCRDWLQSAWPVLTRRIQELRRPELDALDERYRNATVPIPRTDQRHAVSNYGPWHDRRPRVIHTDCPLDLPESWLPLDPNGPRPRLLTIKDH